MPTQKITWKMMDRDLKKGEIIRKKLKNLNSKSRDGYIYARASDGFGMSMDAIGTCIWVENESWTYEECLNKTSQDQARWERSSRIQIMKEVQ